MNITGYMNTLISSYWGMYAVQTVLHSLIASLLVDCAFIAWNIRTPYVKQRFRFMVIFLPIISYPLYQTAFPRRGDAYFRLESLLDSNKWLSLELWRGFPLVTAFVVILALSALIFIIQEFFPLLLHMREQQRETSEASVEPVDQELSRKVTRALEGLPLNEQFVEILQDEDLTLFSDTGLNPMIYVSTGLVKTLTSEQLKAAFAHEIGHIQRTRRPVLIFAYILRVIMFYNPVAMLEFRKLAQEEEKVCDDIAISMTGNPEALAETVELFRPDPEDFNHDTDGRKAGGIASALEHYGHDLLLRSRILSIGERRQDDGQWGISYAVTLALIVVINFYIV